MFTTSLRRARTALLAMALVASTAATTVLASEPAGAGLADPVEGCDPVKLLMSPIPDRLATTSTSSQSTGMCGGVPVVTLPPTDGGTPVDLTELDDVLDTVYVLVPSAHGNLLYLLDAVETETRNNADEGSCDGAQSSPNGYKVVWGGADPPQRFVEYRDSTGHHWSYVRGFATFRSCLEQEMHVKIMQMVGYSVMKQWTGWLIAPADRTVSAWSPTMDCEPDGNEKGYSYRSRVETERDDGWTVNEPAWQNDSSDRWWAYC